MFTNKNSGTLRFSGILCQAIIKGGGCGQAHKYFPFMQSDDRCCKKTAYQKAEIHEIVSLGDFFACILEIV